MNNTPTLSVITPVFNGEKYIRNCLQNVIDQDCHGVEHIICDGLSTDGTVDIIREFAENYPHIRWISEKDGGQSNAMNKGIRMAGGKILGILNVDDYYEPVVLNRVVEIFQTLPEPSFIAGKCNVWYDDTSLLYVNAPRRLHYKQLLTLSPLANFPANPSAYFYHRSVHDMVGLYDEDDHYAMDLDMILRICKVAHTEFFDEVWGNFCMVPGSKTYDDVLNDVGTDRVRPVVEKYIRQLDGWDRRIIGMQAALHSALSPVYCYVSKVGNRIFRN